MKRYAIILLILGEVLLISGGCTSPPVMDGSIQADNAFALAVLGPAIETDDSRSPTYFHLGTGDALGQAIFMNYAALVRANPNWHFADAGDQLY